MQCQKCGHENSPYLVVCENCGTPLDIENNSFLQEKYAKKEKHIDIEELETPKRTADFNTTRKKVSRVIIATFILLIAFFLYILLMFIMDKKSEKLLAHYRQYLHDSSVAVFYFGEEENIHELCEQYSKTYEFDYLQLKSNQLSRRKKQQIRQELNIYNMDSTLVVVQDSKVIATLSDIEKEEALTQFLKKEQIIPERLEDISGDSEKFKEAFQADVALVYFPTGYHSSIEKSSQTLSEISSQYSLPYYEIKGYLFSRNQLLKMMNQIGYSEIQDDLILYIVDGKVEKVIVDTEKKESRYLELLELYDIIDTSSTNFLTPISFDEFQDISHRLEDKYVLLIGSEDCLNCDSTIQTLGLLAHQHHFTIYYLDVADKHDLVSARLQEMGLELGITSVPCLVVMEKGIVLDSIVGTSTRELYIEMLTELGVIR